jgi:hypothetical protein
MNNLKLVVIKKIKQIKIKQNKYFNNLKKSKIIKT